MSGSWLSGWVTGDVVTAAEFRKGAGMIADSTLGSAAASIDFTGLPTSYAHLLVFLHGRGDTAAASVLASLRFNNDSAANYYFQRLFSSAATATAAESLAQTSMGVGALPAATAVVGFGGGVMIAIPGYSGTSFAKGVIAVNAAPLGTTTGTVVTDQRAGVWNSAVAINRITLLAGAGNFAVGTRATVYAFGS